MQTDNFSWFIELQGEKLDFSFLKRDQGPTYRSKYEKNLFFFRIKPQTNMPIPNSI
uniref:Uncharacterized protein n=1 Tax=Arundo donax TaxID=35708 RepID=A0A0A9G512_ARUDO